MTLPELSIRRPVLATVLNLMVIVLGAVAYWNLPVREYPDVDRPVVSVQTTFFGASPLTIESSVTEPLEQALNRVEGVRSLSSVSAFSASQITVELEAGIDVDDAATEVANAIQPALAQLPSEAEKPIISKADVRSQPIMWISLHGGDLAPPDQTDLADRFVKEPLQLLPGVAQVIVGGQRQYAMRVWLEPAKMAARGVEASDVRRAITSNNLQVPAGELEGLARKFTLNVDAQIDDPHVFERLVLRRDGDQAVRLEDVGWVELGSSNYQTITRSDGQPTVGLGVIPQSTANELEVSRTVRAALEDVEASLPEGMSLKVAVDNSVFVEESLQQAFTTLLMVLALVVLVNLTFLRSATTTIITGIAIPISLIGTFAAMWVLGFSVNVLTVLGLVLAIGLLVDDSIVVLENVYRRQELGEDPKQAARNGAREVSFPVLATTAAVVAVLVPLSAIPGNTGRLFREFAWTMAAAVTISTFVALTMVPMSCSLFLRVKSKHGTLWQLIERILRGLVARYDRGLAFFLRHRLLAVGVFLLTLIGSVAFYRLLPTTLAPTEDRGQVMTFVRAPQGSTSAYTDRAMRQAEQTILALPETDATFSAVSFGMGGPADTSNAIVFTRLKKWSERDRSQQRIVQDLLPRFMAIPQALVFPNNPASLGGGRSSDIQLVLKSTDATLEEFDQLTRELIGELRQLPLLTNVDSNVRLDNPEINVVIDRERAADLGISVSAVAESLRLLVAEGPIADFVLDNRQYNVIMSLAAQHRSMPEQLQEIHLRAADGSMVPLASLVDLRPRIGAPLLTHYGLQRSATLSANLAADAPLGAALDQVMAIVEPRLPDGFSTDLAGQTREFVESAGAIFITFGVALIVIYLVLAAQFESFIHPLTVMFSVPLAALGALGTLALAGHSLNLFSGIGLILLVGLVTKNAILLVDFANQARARGMALFEALRAAGHTRFRPILMTSLTSILGAVPLALAYGAGAESRRPIGVAVVGGLVFSTLFTLLIIPPMHILLIRAAERLGLSTIPPAIELDASPESKLE